MKNVVIIEDDPTILEMYKLKFETEGHRVYTATNGIEGLQILGGVHADVVLLDLMMPNMDGTTMLQELRKTAWGKKLPVIILTNVSEDEKPAALDELNIVGYVIKASSTPQQVVTRVQALFDSK